MVAKAAQCSQDLKASDSQPASLAPVFLAASHNRKKHKGNWSLGSQDNPVPWPGGERGRGDTVTLASEWPARVLTWVAANLRRYWRTVSDHELTCALSLYCDFEPHIVTLALKITEFKVGEFPRERGLPPPDSLLMGWTLALLGSCPVLVVSIFNFYLQ